MTTAPTQQSMSNNGSELLLRADGVSKIFVAGTFRKHYTHALDTVSFSVPESPPTITAIAGESGSGKNDIGADGVGVDCADIGRGHISGNKRRRDVARTARGVLGEKFRSSFKTRSSLTTRSTKSTTSCGRPFAGTTSHRRNLRPTILLKTRCGQ